MKTNKKLTDKPTDKTDVGNPKNSEQPFVSNKGDGIYEQIEEQQPKYILLKRSLSIGEKPEDIKWFMFQHLEASEFEFKKIELSDEEKEILNKRNMKHTPQVGDEFDSEIGRLVFYNLNLKEKCEMRKVIFTEEIHEYENGEKKPYNVKTYSEPLTYVDVPEEDLVITLIGSLL